MDDIAYQRARVQVEARLVKVKRLILTPVNRQRFNHLFFLTLHLRVEIAAFLLKTLP
ncbi:MAG: hypothetical protein ABJB22_00130 [Verrucomicrobiota bacterium]